MTAEEITKIRRGKEKAYHRQWDNYQATGAANYYNAAKRYADLVEICDQALAAADDHAEALHLRGSFSQLASRADDILHDGGHDIEAMKQLLRDVRAIAEGHGFSSKWR